MTQHTPWINNGGRIERLLKDETTEVLCTIGEVNNQRLEDTEKAYILIKMLNSQTELHGEITRLRQDKAELVGTLGETVAEIEEHITYAKPPIKNRLIGMRTRAKAVLAKHGKKS